MATGMWLISYGNRLASFSAILIGLLNIPGCYRFFLQTSLYAIMEWSLEMVV